MAVLSKILKSDIQINQGEWIKPSWIVGFRRQGGIYTAAVSPLLKSNLPAYCQTMINAMLNMAKNSDLSAILISNEDSVILAEFYPHVFNWKKNIPNP